jgi:hypothetical protein
MIKKSKADPMSEGIDMIEEMMRDARRSGSTVTNDEKIKMLAVYAKLKQVSRDWKQGGMGRGFDDAETDDDGI